MEELSNEMITTLKLELNRLIWMYARPTLTLEQAEVMACRILAEITDREEGSE
jgi:hypothetical protein